MEIKNVPVKVRKEVISYLNKWRDFFDLKTWDFEIYYYTKESYDSIKQFLNKSECSRKLKCDGFTIILADYLKSLIFINLNHWTNMDDYIKDEMIAHELFHSIYKLYNEEQLNIFCIRKFMLLLKNIKKM